MRRLERLARRWRERGARATLAKLVHDHLFAVSDGVGLEYLHDAPARARADTARFAFTTVRDPTALPPLGPYLAPRAAAFRSHLGAGKVAMFVLEDGAAVGCGWLSLADHHDADTGERFAVAPGEAYAFCWLLDPASGRRGAGLPFARYTIAAARALGLSRQYAVIERANRASFLIHRHFGFREFGLRVRHYRMLRARWTRVSHYRGELGPA